MLYLKQCLGTPSISKFVGLIPCHSVQLTLLVTKFQRFLGSSPLKGNQTFSSLLKIPYTNNGLKLSQDVLSKNTTYVRMKHVQPSWHNKQQMNIHWQHPQMKTVLHKQVQMIYLSTPFNQREKIQVGLNIKISLRLKVTLVFQAILLPIVQTVSPYQMD